MSAPFWISHDDNEFPPVELAMKDPDGLLAVGGDLSVGRLVNAYRHGIFPWYSDGQPILWWSPDPRLVLYPTQVIIHRSLAKTLRKQPFEVRFDNTFSEVIQACAGPRRDADGTWITNEMQQAYLRLHKAGYAHSIECWQDDRLVGGLYGIAIGKVFFGESMFSLVSDASKVALVYLCAHLIKWHFSMIDCQVETPHLINMGAVSIPREKFVQQLQQDIDKSFVPGKWSVDDTIKEAITATGKLNFLY
jgi:leucyl/phenylalanyl-tRNA--protein transferase